MKNCDDWVASIYRYRGRTILDSVQIKIAEILQSLTLDHLDYHEIDAENQKKRPRTYLCFCEMV